MFCASVCSATLKFVQIQRLKIESRTRLVAFGTKVAQRAVTATDCHFCDFKTVKSFTVLLVYMTCM